MKYVAKIGERSFDLETAQGTVRVGGEELQVSSVPIDDGSYSMIIGGRSYRVYVEPDGHRLEVTLNGRSFHVLLQDEHDLFMERLGQEAGWKGGNSTIRAPMPGLVRRVHVSTGERVVAGQPLIVLEAMKMENEIRAEHSGIVRAMHATEGAPVEKDQLLVEVDASDE